MPCSPMSPAYKNEELEYVPRMKPNVTYPKVEGPRIRLSSE